MALLIAYMSNSRRDFADILDAVPDISLQCYPSSYAISQVLRSAILRHEYQHLLIVRNTDVLLLPSLLQRVQEVAVQLDNSYRWLVAAAGGRGVDNQWYEAVYDGQMPRLSGFLAISPLIDIIPDVYLVNLRVLADIVPDRDISAVNDTIEKWLIHHGYQNGCVSIYHPQLRYVTPYRMSYDLAEDQRSVIAHLVGDKNIEQALNQFNDAIDATLIQHCKLPSISLVTRTQFTRLPLLRRLLTSVSRAVREANADVECILATDIPIGKVRATYEELARDYPYLKLRLAYQTPNEMASRVANLLTGIRAARNDYIWMIDDDDFVYPRAFRDLCAAFFAQSPLFVVCSSDVIEEKWLFKDDRQAVRTDFRLEKTYSGKNWRNVFSGVNPLPICSYITPREFIQARVADFEFRHDLSEDYTLLLLLFTSPHLPPIVEVEKSLVGISVRTAGDNVVNMTNRTHWLAQTHLFLGDLQSNPSVASGGQWQLYTLLAEMADETVAPEIQHWKSRSINYQERIAELEAERDGLRSLLAGLQARYASDRAYRMYQQWKDKTQRESISEAIRPSGNNALVRVSQLFGTAWRMTRDEGLIPMLRQFGRWLRGERRY